MNCIFELCNLSSIESFTDTLSDYLLLVADKRTLEEAMSCYSASIAIPNMYRYCSTEHVSLSYFWNSYLVENKQCVDSALACPFNAYIYLSHVNTPVDISRVINTLCSSVYMSHLTLDRYGCYTDNSSGQTVKLLITPYDFTLIKRTAA